MGRYLRWQALIALLGIFLLAALLSYAAYSFTTVTVPDRGGTFVEGVAGNPQYLNPLLSQNSDVDGDLTALLFNGLTRLDEQGNVVPDLAGSWVVSTDTLKYDFTLRDQLYWHDDVPVTAADVLYTVNAMQNPDFPGMKWLNTLWSSVQVSACDGPEGHTVRFELAQPLSSFLDYTTVGLLPAHLWGRVPITQMMQSQLNTHPIGTGPFKLGQITAVRADLTPNPRYHNGPARYLSGFTFRFYPDHQSLLSAYDRREIDGISVLWPEDMGTAGQRKDLQLLPAPMAGYALVYLNLQNPNVPFFQEVAVRKALLYALDRPGLIRDVLQGQGLVANSPVMPGNWAYDADVNTYPYHAETARKLLDEAGWIDSDGDGVRDRGGVKLAFILVGSNSPLVEALSTAWARIGVQAAAQPVTMAGLTTDFLVPRAFDAAVVDWTLSGDPDPYPLWHSSQIKDGQNYAGWSDAATDDALEKARAVADAAARKHYYVAFQRRFAEEVPALLLYHPIYTYGVRDKVHNVRIGPLNSPGDRFLSVSDWYIVTRRITVGSATALFDSPVP